MTTGALIAAAGKDMEMAAFRPMLKLNGTTLIQREIDTLRRADVSPIVVITGWEAAELERHLAHRGVVCLRNDRYAETKMLDSVKIGLEYLKSRCDRVVFLPVDAPLFSVDSLERVMKTDGDFGIPIFGEKKGHPILMDGRVFDDILAYDGENGLRGVMSFGDHRIEYVEVEDRGILMEVNDEEAYREILAYQEESLRNHRLHSHVDLQMGKESWFFHTETADFLELIDSEGSMLGACKKMSMSYSHGWKMIKNVEESMGFPFLNRKAGGSSGGNSTLTPRGKDFLRCYRKMQRDMENHGRELFAAYFEEYLLESDE